MTSPFSARKNQQILDAMPVFLKLLKKYKIKSGFGTDIVGPSQDWQNKEFIYRSKYFSAAEVLRQATSESAEIIRHCGPLNPYGKFGEIQEGWLADLLILNGDPLKKIQLLENPEKNIALIMKGGEIFKNQL